MFLNKKFTLSFLFQKSQMNKMIALWSDQVVACLHSKSVPELKIKNQEQSITASDYFLFFTYIEKHLNIMKGWITQMSEEEQHVVF